MTEDKYNPKTQDSISPIAVSGNGFIRHGAPFYYLADTAWSIITNSCHEERQKYFQLRSDQGFTVIQVNLLPQWDRSRDDKPFDDPFALASDGKMEVGQPCRRYFEQVDRVLSEMVSYGLVPAIVLMWADIVPGTWAYEKGGYKLDSKDVESYIEYTVSRLKKYQPIYIVGGDTDLDKEVSVNFYNRGLETLEKLVPKSLKTIHLAGGLHSFPKEFRQDLLSFYMYQSGHTVEGQDLVFKIPDIWIKSGVVKPIINGELCYEGHKKVYMNPENKPSDQEVFNGEDVFHAAYKSLVVGKCHGIAYGAHGIWNWHRKGMKLANETFTGTSPTLDEAMRFKGANMMRGVISHITY